MGFEKPKHCPYGQIQRQYLVKHTVKTLCSFLFTDVLLCSRWKVRRHYMYISESLTSLQLIMTTYQMFTLLIPILSAAIVGLLTYFFALKSKKFDLLYQNKVPAFKEIALKLTAYRNFCLGRVAFLQGNEFSPFWESGPGALHHRTEIANVIALNSIFLSKRNNDFLYSLLNDMSLMCNMEVSLITNPEMNVDSNIYFNEVKRVDSAIQSLYSELNLY